MNIIFFIMLCLFVCLFVFVCLFSVGLDRYSENKAVEVIKKEREQRWIKTPSCPSLELPP